MYLKKIVSLKFVDCATKSIEVRGQFHQHFTSSFYTPRSLKHKKTDGFTVFLGAFGICGRKSCWWNVPLITISITILLSNLILIFTFEDNNYFIGLYPTNFIQPLSLKKRFDFNQNWIPEEHVDELIHTWKWTKYTYYY